MSAICNAFRMMSSRNVFKGRFHKQMPALIVPSLWTSPRHLSVNSSPPISKTNPSDKKKVKVVFKRTSGDVIEVQGKIGDTLLDVVVNNNVDIDGFGACEGTLSCSTCHLILKQVDFDRIKEKPTDEELDMLDLAYGLTDTLGCQIFLTQELDGLEVQIPEGINDVRIEPS